MGNPDWTALAAIAGIVLAMLALAGAAMAYGAHRQKIKDLEDRMSAIEAAITTTQETKTKVEVLVAEVRGFRAEMSGEMKHAAEMATERTEGLRNEVRAFMQGQTSMGATRPRARPQQG